MATVEKNIYLTEEQAAELFHKIKPILDSHNLLNNEADWTHFYDSEKDQLIVGYSATTEDHDENQLEIYERVMNNTQNGYVFHYWNNDSHVCEFTTDYDGTLQNMISE